MSKDDPRVYRFWKQFPKRMLNTGCVAGGVSTIDGVWSCDIDKVLVDKARERGFHADLIDLNKETPCALYNYYT